MQADARSENRKIGRLWLKGLVTRVPGRSVRRMDSCALLAATPQRFLLNPKWATLDLLVRLVELALVLSLSSFSEHFKAVEVKDSVFLDAGGPAVVLQAQDFSGRAAEWSQQGPCHEIVNAQCKKQSGAMCGSSLIRKPRKQYETNRIDLIYLKHFQADWNRMKQLDAQKKGIKSHQTHIKTYKNRGDHWFFL